MIYLDNNATTFLIPAVRARIEELMAAPIGNPSSPYRLGAEARAALEQARDRVADALGTRADGILFVASGSEANAMALAVAQSCEQRRDEILVSAVEHSLGHRQRKPCSANAATRCVTCPLMGWDASTLTN